MLVSSHLMDELAHIADRVLVIGHSRVLADCAVADVPAGPGLTRDVEARCSDPGQLVDAFGRADDPRRGAAIPDTGPVLNPDATTSDVAAAAAAAGLTLSELVEVTPSLEQAHLTLTESATQYRATTCNRPIASVTR